MPEVLTLCFICTEEDLRCWGSNSQHPSEGVEYTLVPSHSEVCVWLASRVAPMTKVPSVESVTIMYSFNWNSLLILFWCLLYLPKNYFYSVSACGKGWTVVKIHTWKWVGYSILMAIPSSTLQWPKCIEIISDSFRTQPPVPGFYESFNICFLNRLISSEGNTFRGLCKGKSMNSKDPTFNIPIL